MMVEAIPVFFGFEELPSGVDVDWHGLEPVAEGANSTSCAAAIVPAGPYESGATEGFSRYLAAARGRGELAVVVCEMADSSSGPFAKSGEPPTGIWTGVPDGRLSARRLPSGLVLELPEDLSGPERDLALRLRNRPGEPPWFGITRDQFSAPIGELRPILFSDLGEIVAATWTSHDESMKWFLLPWGVDWQSTLDWLETQALPDLVPKAFARARRGWEEELSTQEEQGARVLLQAFEARVDAEREELQQRILYATEEADKRRHPLLYGSGQALADAVASVLGESELSVESLDATFGSGRSGDYLVTHEGRHWLVEVTSSSGAIAEIEIGKVMTHVETWPKLRSEPIEAGVMVVNHDSRRAPSERPSAPYRRQEFVDSLRVTVLGTIPLCRWWVKGEFSAIVDAITGPIRQIPNR